MKNNPAEIDFILTSLRTHSSAQADQHKTKQLDWDKVASLAQQHHILPYIYNSFSAQLKEEIPSHINQNIKSYCNWLMTRNLHMTSHLLKTLQLLNQNNIQAIPIKGPVLAQLAYNNISLRDFTDLDILISEKDITSIQKLLLQQGYSVNIKLSPEQQKRFIKHENFFSFTHPRHKITIDLHWELSGRYNLIPISLEQVHAQLLTIDINGIDIHTLSIEKTIVYLCIHSTSHCWESIEWIICIANLIQNNPDLNWDQIFDWSHELHCKKMVLLGIYLAVDLTKVRIPNSSRNKINAEPTIKKLALQIKTSLFTRDSSTNTISWRFSPIHFAVRDSLRDKLWYFLRLFFSPTVADWQQYRAPSQLSFLYFISRPFRLAWGVVKKNNKEENHGQTP